MEERLLGQEIVLLLAQELSERGWKRLAAQLLVLARLGADARTLLAALMAEAPRPCKALQETEVGREVEHLLKERQVRHFSSLKARPGGE